LYNKGNGRTVERNGSWKNERRRESKTGRYKEEEKRKLIKRGTKQNKGRPQISCKQINVQY
jgi:hypothetical protein